MKTTLLVLALFLTFTTSSSAQSDKYKGTPTKQWKWIPADFDPRVGVLLIEEVTFPKRQGKIMQEYMEQNYPYKYEFVSLQDLKDKSSRYADTSIYRFAVVNSYKSSAIKHGGVPVGMTDFSFYDRRNEFVYPPTGKGSSWASMTFKPFIATVLKATQSSNN